MKKKIVIIGGGFAGTTVAKKMENHFDVTLVDSKNFFEFTPGILRTIVEPNHGRKVQAFHRDWLMNTTLLVGCVEKIRPSFIVFQKKKIPFDYLVICTGSRYSTPIKSENVSSTNRASDLASYHKKLERAKKVVLVGGGIVGVELAAEIICKYPQKSVTLIHSQETLMQRNHKRTGICAEKFLEERGVKFYFGKRGIVKEKEVLVGNLSFPSDLTFVCTGITPNSEVLHNYPKLLDKRKCIVVNNFLQVKSFKNIFSAGDVNSFREEKTAQNAEKQAEVVVRNIRGLEGKEPLKEYMTKLSPFVISLGKFRGIFEYKGCVFDGVIPSFLKRFIEFKEMWKRK